VRALHRLGVEIELRNLDVWGSEPLPPEKADPWFETLARPVDASVYLRFAMPHQVLPEPGLVNVNYTMFEATRIHPSWVAQACAYDRVIVPQAWCRDVWIASGAPAERVRVCPLGIDPELYGPEREPYPLFGSARVRFLNVSEVNRRKNLRALLRVWQRATTPDDDAALLVKLATGEAGLEKVRRWLTGESAPVGLTCARLSDEEMPHLYASATHYLSLSHGEAWDLPMLEAAASGLELVAPRHTAYATYLDDGCAHLVPSVETPVELREDDDNYVLFRGASWWTPDEDAAVELVRAIVRGEAERKQAPRERVLRDFTWDAAGRRLLELLTEAEQERPRGRRRRASALWRRTPAPARSGRRAGRRRP
jgi:glycosyltransferase involved in cell wall biosynthesis